MPMVAASAVTPEMPELMVAAPNWRQCQYSFGIRFRLRRSGNGAHGVAQCRESAEFAAAGIDGDEETIAATNCADAILAVVNGEFGLGGLGVRTLHGLLPRGFARAKQRRPGLSA
jgi:hypothetical protein